MKVEIDQSVVHHREQSASNRCVPACTSMVLSRLGRPMAEEEICAGWQGSGRGYALEDAARILGGRYLEPDPTLLPTYVWIREKLRRSHWCIVNVFTGKLAEIVWSMNVPPVSRFGVMRPDDRGLHAVVLVGVIDERFCYLDPYYPALLQPFSMSREELFGAFTGHLIEIPLV